MSPATKEQAIVKLKGIEDKIGYPAQLARLLHRHIARDSYLNNVAQATSFEFERWVDEDRQTRRPRRMDHDAAHHQRLLRSAD